MDEPKPQPKEAEEEPLNDADLEVAGGVLGNEEVDTKPNIWAGWED